MENFPTAHLQTVLWDTHVIHCTLMSIYYNQYISKTHESCQISI